MPLSFSRCLSILALSALCFGLAPAVVWAEIQPSARTDAGDWETPVSPSASLEEAEDNLPELLSGTDADLYRRIFDLQEDGNWKAADKLIAELEDRLLMGHVLAQRYLHPTKYRSRYKELKAWLDKYADHPDAARIYKLALKRRPKNWRYPKKPTAGRLTLDAHAALRGSDLRPPAKKRMSSAQRKKASRYERRIRRAARRGWTLAAKRELQSKQVKNLLDPFDYDRLQATLGYRYFIDGRDEWALEWAGRAAERSGKYLPEAHWAAGLAAWRLQRLAQAARHFEGVAASPNSSPWMVSAGAFWAARCHLANQAPERFNGSLRIAASHPYTFYGLIARRILGEPITFRWSMPPMTSSVVAAVLARPNGRRALALVQLNRESGAERELRGLAAKSDRDLVHGMLGIAARTHMPALAIRLNNYLHPKGGGYDGAAYPTPEWTPHSGFRVDRALIFALMRQESGFNPRAKSWAGARGLMQLMPRTASFVARDRRLHGSRRNTLYEPGLNLELGQRYIEILLRDDRIGNDLYRLAAAWNGGPGNLNKWRRTTNYGDDPLLFIESIPSQETRIFIERVLTNLWIYRHRLGQPTPSLDAVASGARPAYASLDEHPVEVATHGKD